MTTAGEPSLGAVRRLGVSAPVSYAARLLAVGLAYYVAARAGLLLAVVGDSVTPLWPPTGLALVAVLAFGPSMWPAIGLAAFAVNLPISPTPAAAAAIAFGNTLGPLIAAALLKRIGFRTDLERVRDALALLFLAALLAMLVSSTVGTGTLVASGEVASSQALETFLAWWTGDAMGVLIVAPFLWSLRLRRRPAVRLARFAEAVALFAALGVATGVALTIGHSLLFVIPPLLGWIAWRFQRRAAAPAGLLVSIAVTWAAVSGGGPFAEAPLLVKMITLQAFNAAVAVTSVFFAAAVTEKLRAREALERAAGELEDAVARRTGELTAANEQLVREVAERTEAQRVLQQRELQLAEAQSIAHLGSWEWDVAQDRVRWSDELYRIFGVQPQDFRATFAGYLERIHPDDRALVRGSIQHALADVSEFAFQHRIVRPDGSERTIHSRGSVISDPTGAPARMVGTAQDITERSLADRALRESEERFRTVFESAAIGMAQCDPAGRILKTNAALQQLTGRAEADLHGLELIELTHPEDRPRNADLFVRLLRGQLSSFDIEERLVRGDGRTVWASTSVSAARDASGKPKFVHLIVHDVTARRRAEALQRAEAERARLRELFSEVPAVVFVTRGPDHVIEFANKAFGSLVGDRECVGTPLAHAVPEISRGGQLELIDRVFASGEPFVASEAVLSLDADAGAETGQERFFNLVYQPVRDARGQVDGVLAHAVDVTETIRGRQRVTESLAFLDTLLRTAPAGFAVFDTQLRHVRINERLAEMNGLPAEAHLGRTLGEILPHLAGTLEPLLTQVLQTQEPITDIELTGSSAAATEKKHWLASYYPINAPGTGMLGVGAVVVEITERKRFEKLLSGQKEVLELVARGADRVDVLNALARTAEEQSAGGTRASILLAEPDGTLRRGAAPSLSEAFVSAVDGTPIGPTRGSCGAAAHAKEPVFVSDIATDPKWRELRDVAIGNGLRAAWSWPVLAADRAVLGTFCLYCTQPRLPTAREKELLDVLTQTAAIAIERDRAERERLRLIEREREAQARLYEREHLVAETLQRSLLPDRLPETPGVSVAARYIPASADVEVGGDWYDIIPLHGGRLGLAIGDVAGHGIAAAAAMGQMRMALRAYALEDLAPAAALGRLNRLLLELQPGAMSTVLYCQFDPATGDVRFASAGHPPPLLVRAPADGQFLEGGLAPPLGVLHDADYREASAVIEPGATLLLYTDGLVERRREPIDDGLGLLRAAACAAPADLEEACDHILGSLLGEGVADDVALLAVQWVSLAGQRLRVRRPALPATVPELRRVLGRWLAQNGADGDEGYEILVAFAEAYTNAVQHAYRSGYGAIDVEAAAREGEILITVRDYGAWKPPATAADDGGRGLVMMQGLMEAVDVASSVDGTEIRMRRRLGALIGG